MWFAEENPTPPKTGILKKFPLSGNSPMCFPKYFIVIMEKLEETVISYILEFISDPITILSAATTCKRFHRASKREFIWVRAWPWSTYNFKPKKYRLETIAILKNEYTLLNKMYVFLQSENDSVIDSGLRGISAFLQKSKFLEPLVELLDCMCYIMRLETPPVNYHLLQNKATQMFLHTNVVTDNYLKHFRVNILLTSLTPITRLTYNLHFALSYHLLSSRFTLQIICSYFPVFPYSPHILCRLLLMAKSGFT